MIVGQKYENPAVKKEKPFNYSDLSRSGKAKGTYAVGGNQHEKQTLCKIVRSDDRHDPCSQRRLCDGGR